MAVSVVEKDNRIGKQNVVREQEQLKLNNLKTFAAMVATSIGSLLISQSAFAQIPANPVKKSTIPASHAVHPVPAYTLLQREIADTNPKDFVWEVVRSQSVPPQTDDSPPPPQHVFKSLDSVELKRWISYLPVGSIIDFPYIVSGMLSSTPVDLASVTKKLGVDDFSQYCKSKTVRFFFVPAVL